MTIKKEVILNYLQTSLDEKINLIEDMIASITVSRNNETKSSAGDKYETGRAMMQFELEKNQIQLNQLLKQKYELLQIKANKIYKTADFGALVITNRGNYFISAGVGKCTIDNQICYAVSLASPIGKFLQGKTIGEKATFNGQYFEITGIL